MISSGFDYVSMPIPNTCPYQHHTHPFNQHKNIIIFRVAIGNIHWYHSASVFWALAIGRLHHIDRILANPQCLKEELHLFHLFGIIEQCACRSCSRFPATPCSTPIRMTYLSLIAHGRDFERGRKEGTAKRSYLILRRFMMLQKGIIVEEVAHVSPRHRALDTLPLPPLKKSRVNS